MRNPHGIFSSCRRLWAWRWRDRFGPGWRGSASRPGVVCAGRGEALILRGPNGSGKTTLLRTLAGLQPALAGEISSDPDSIAYAGHADGIKATLTVAENLHFWAAVYGTARHRPRAGGLRPRIAARDRPGAGASSAGQKRRLGLARLLVTGRPIWVLDEPTVSLDVHAVGLFAAAVRAHLDGGGAALIATHIDLGSGRASWMSAWRRFAARKAGPAAWRFRRGLPVIRLFTRDMALAVRAGGGFGLGLAFFLIITVLVPFGVGPQSALLGTIAPGVLWIGALLACLLSLDRIFQLDYEDGSLDLLATAPIPLEGVVAMKAAAHWVTTGLPLTLAAPLLGVLLNLPRRGYVWLVVSLALGTPALS